MRLLAYCVTLVIMACTNEVALAANPDNGSTLAQRWCTGCHVVSGDRVQAAASGTLDVADNIERVANNARETGNDIRTDAEIGTGTFGGQHSPQGRGREVPGQCARRMMRGGPVIPG
jgi:hypothetical protein